MIVFSHLPQKYTFSLFFNNLWCVLTRFPFLHNSGPCHRTVPRDSVPSFIDRSRSIGCQHCRKSEAVRMDITVSPVSRGSWGKTGHIRRFEVFAIYLTETFLHSEYTSRYKVQYKLE